MNIFIRTDASINIGTGHVIRCLTLSDELAHKGTNVSFICKEEKGNLIELIEEKGYIVHRLPESIDLETDKKLTQKVFCNIHTLPDWLITDHYGIDISWESSIRKSVKKIMVIDDLANRKHDCDLLLNQNYSLNENRYRGLLPGHCIKLLGPEYALLRSQFSIERKRLRERNGKVKRILVFMGGVDPTNESCKAVRATQMLNRLDIATDVVIGPFNPHRVEVELLGTNMPNATCHFNVSNMAKLMAYADLCIGAGGSTAWERCCLGLPALVTILAKNQEDLTISLAHQGSIINLGWATSLSAEDYLRAMTTLDAQELKRMSLQGLKLIDGKGARRVIQAMSDLSVTLGEMASP